MSNFKNWKTDNYKFVGKAFDFTYKNTLSKLSPVIGEANAKSIDYEITGSGGYGEAPRYDGSNLNMAQLHRGFKTIITPEEFNLSVGVGYKEAKVDQMGETAKVGSKLGQSMAMTVYRHVLRMFANAWDANYTGGDGKPWAAADHPVASLGSQGRRFIPDPDAGTYSNVLELALSAAAVTAAQAVGGRYLTPDGLEFAADFDTVLVSTELEGKAASLFGKESKILPGSTDFETDGNPVSGMRYLVMPGFTGQQWAICDRSLMKELAKIVYITRPMVEQAYSPNPFIDLYAGYCDFGVGWGDARQIIFSNP